MDSPRTEPRSVAQLAGARLPADRGLSSLGLLMELFGSIFLAYMAFFALVPIFSGGSPAAWQIFLLGASGAVRSAFHRSAGTALIYGTPATPYRAVRNYIVVAVIETALWLFILKGNGSAFSLPTSVLFVAAVVLLAWPLTLGIVISLPSFKPLLDNPEVAASEDLGFEGTAVLMSVFGVFGAIIGGVFLLELFELPGEDLSSPHALLTIGVVLMLLIRSVMHATAGFKGVSGSGSELASESAARYYNFGVVSSIVAGGAFFIMAMMVEIRGVAFLGVAVFVYTLLVWPLSMRRFYTERNFSVLLAGAEAPNFRRAPDAGMTSLGWLFLMLSVFGLSVAVPSLLIGGGADAPLSFGRSPWWGIGASLVQLWAAIELIQMTDRFRLAANVYGVVAAAVTLYLVWPMFGDFSELVRGAGRGGADGAMTMVVYGYIAMALVVPVATIILANRRLAPEATARIRE